MILPEVGGHVAAVRAELIAHEADDRLTVGAAGLHVGLGHLVLARFGVVADPSLARGVGKGGEVGLQA